MSQTIQKQPRKNRNWKPIVSQAITQINRLNSDLIKPTLRTVFYYLLSIGLIHNTKSDYGMLSDKLVKARKAGDLAWDALSDNVRDTIGIPDPYVSPEDYILRGINYIKDAGNRFALPRWHGQKHYVEFWIEKDAMAGTVASILGPRQIVIAVNRGNDGWTHFWESCERIKKQIRHGKKVHIFYLGDYDPSGQGMITDLKSRFAEVGMSLKYGDIEFRPLGVTEPQIKELGLPKKFDSDTGGKLTRDPRRHAFRAANDGQLFAVELDALAAYNMSYFKSLISTAADEYFDRGIYQQTLKEEERNLVEISALVSKLRLEWG